MIDLLPGRPVELQGGRRLGVDEVLYWYDSPLLFVGSFDPPMEGGPNLFMSIEDTKDHVIHMGTTVDEAELAAIRSDTLTLRDAFRRSGTYSTRCGDGWTLLEMGRFDSVNDIPDDWLSEPDTMLHPDAPSTDRQT